MSRDIQQLKRLGMLREQRDNLDARIAKQVAVGRSRGLTITEMARRLKMSRQGLYKLLDRENSR